MTFRTTDAMQAQIAAVRRLLAEGMGPQGLRELGYAQGAIDAAINEEAAK